MTTTTTEDPLDQLIRTRGDEMSPSLRALSILARIWLGLVTFFGTMGSVAAGVAAIYFMTKLKLPFPLHIVGYLLIAWPMCIAGVLGTRAARRALARSLTRAIERSLDGVGGLSSPVALSLRVARCAHASVTVDGISVRDLVNAPRADDERRVIFMLDPVCGDCGAHLDAALDLGGRTAPGGDLYDARFVWQRPEPVQPVG